MFAAHMNPASLTVIPMLSAGLLLATPARAQDGKADVIVARTVRHDPAGPPPGKPAADGSAGATPALGARGTDAPAEADGQSPAAVGLARIVTNWPGWLTITFVERGRLEAVRRPAPLGAAYDAYYLNRFRLTTLIRATTWLHATVQLQDSRVGGYAVSPPPNNLSDPFDLRVASVELGGRRTKGVAAIVGRQELTLGDGRLMASPDWGNVSRTYDGIRLAVIRPRFRLDVFGAAPLDVARNPFARAKAGERVYGVWVTAGKVRRLTYLDGYTIAKFNATAIGETGSRGSQAIYATGARAGGTVTSNVAWDAETTVQYGHSAADAVLAWGTHESVAWPIGRSSLGPKLVVEYNYASGDSDPGDGERQTFDQMYASVHGKWGLADLFGWRNLHHAAIKLEASPARALKVGAALNHMWLATVNDAWYGPTGSIVALNRNATSRDVGWEPDLSAAYTLTRDVSVGVGLGVLIGGGFVAQSTEVARIWAPYVMCTASF